MEKETGTITLRVLITETSDKLWLKLMLLGMEIRRTKMVMHPSVVVATRIILDNAL